MGNMKLMIVDDEERFLNTTRSIFEKKGIHTFIAANGADAMNILDRERIDVVILDVKMPGLDGIEALRVMKKSHPFVEVIMLTGHANMEVAIQGMELGAFDYLMKPMDIDELLYKLQDAYRKRRCAADMEKCAAMRTTEME